MRDYQRQKNNKYILPRAQYHFTLWLLRDYHRLKDEIEAKAYASPQVDGMPRGTQTGDPTAKNAIKLERAIDIVNLIDSERMNIPEEYREGVWNNIQYGTAYPMDADRSTYGRAKSRFIYRVAMRYESM
jgi:hypothetical protein